MSDIIEKVIRVIKKDKLNKKNRKRELVNKRMFLFKVLKKEGLTLKSIGSFFNLDHCTVLYGLKRYKELKSCGDLSLKIDTHEYQYIFNDRKFNLSDDVMEAKSINDLMLIKNKIEKDLY